MCYSVRIVNFSVFIQFTSIFPFCESIISVYIFSQAIPEIAKTIVCNVYNKIARQATRLLKWRLSHDAMKRKTTYYISFWISNLQYLKCWSSPIYWAVHSFNQTKPGSRHGTLNKKERRLFDAHFFWNFRSLWRRAARRQGWLVRTTVRSTKPNLLKMAPKWVTWWLCARKKRRLLPNSRRWKNLPLFPPSLEGEQTNYNNNKNLVVFQKITTVRTWILSLYMSMYTFLTIWPKVTSEISFACKPQ
jgi:hypothetical protein